MSPPLTPVELEAVRNDTPENSEDVFVDVEGDIDDLKKDYIDDLKKDYIDDLQKDDIPEQRVITSDIISKDEVQTDASSVRSNFTYKSESDDTEIVFDRVLNSFRVLEDKVDEGSSETEEFDEYFRDKCELYEKQHKLITALDIKIQNDTPYLSVETFDLLFNDFCINTGKSFYFVLVEALFWCQTLL